MKYFSNKIKTDVSKIITISQYLLNILNIKDVASKTYSYGFNHYLPYFKNDFMHLLFRFIFHVRVSQIAERRLHNTPTSNDKKIKPNVSGLKK